MNQISRFERRYRKSLNGYRFFYDDICTYGRTDTAKHVFYFIPGLNGVPGQIRFALPSFHRALGKDIYIRCLYLPEFSAKIPVWDKYTPANLEKRLTTIREDVEWLISRHGRVNVVASSTGFYEFAAAIQGVPGHVRENVTLLWVAASPDHVEPNRWESLFHRFNGIERNGYRWTALPNHNMFSFINPETRMTLSWRNGGGSQVLYKHNLESRFRALGVSWAYFSLECINDVLRRCTDCVSEPLVISTYILAAQRDGYWQGQSKEDMMLVMRRYVMDPQVMWKDASHLWVNIPENVTGLIECAMRSGSDSDPNREDLDMRNNVADPVARW